MSPKRLSTFFDKPLENNRPSTRQTRCQTAATRTSSAKNVSPGRQSFLKGAGQFKTTIGTTGGLFGTQRTGMLLVPRSETERLYQSAPEVQDEERETLAIEEERFAVSGVIKPTPIVIKKPEIQNEFLLLPHQRKALQDYELERQKARSLGRKARADRKRMTDLMQNHHPTGVLGMQEAVAESGTDVYKQIKQRELSQKERLDKSMSRVRATHVQWTDGMARRGYQFLAFEPQKAPVEAKIAGMRGVGHRPALTMEQSRERLFEGKDLSVNLERREYLKAKDRGGKSFNILNGGHW